MMGSSSEEKQASSFEFVAAPEDLTPYVNSLYSWQTDEPDFAESLPAYSGQLVAFVRGVARMQFDGGSEGVTSDGFFLAPLLQARKFRVQGPARLFGVSLNFRGWASLTGLSVDRFHDRFLDLDEGLRPSLTAPFRDLAPAWRAKEIDDATVLDRMAQIVREGIGELPEQYLTVIDETLKWLSSSLKPELADLYDRLPYSERQAQRLVARFFGQSPIRLIRRYRAIRAATLLSLPQLPEQVESEIRDAFYDQAHLIKEISFFTGQTPKRLLPDPGSGVIRMLGPEGYGSVDLFGGNQDEQLGRTPR